MQFTEQKVFLRHDVERDVMELLLVYEGLHPVRRHRVSLGETIWGAPETREQREWSRENRAREAYGNVRRIADGERFFVLGAPLLEVDLDLMDRLPETDEEVDLQHDAFRKGIAVTASGLYLDGDGRLCAYQAIRIPEASLALRLLNGAVHEGVKEWPNSASFEADTPALDAETRAAWIREARDGVPWIALHRGGLRIRFPATPRTAALLLEHLLEEIADQDDRESEDEAGAEGVAGNPARSWSALASCLAGIEVGDGHLTLDFRSGAKGRPTLRLVHSDARYSSWILEQFRQDGRHPRKMTEKELLEKAWAP